MAEGLRTRFVKGDEQGNERLLQELVELEGEGAFDVLIAVLQDTVDVGGIYSNLRPAALRVPMRDEGGRFFTSFPVVAAVHDRRRTLVQRLVLPS